jgi:hypothetical protein
MPGDQDWLWLADVWCAAAQKALDARLTALVRSTQPSSDGRCWRLRPIFEPAPAISVRRDAGAILHGRGRATKPGWGTDIIAGPSSYRGAGKCANPPTSAVRRSWSHHTHVIAATRSMPSGSLSSNGVLPLSKSASTARLPPTTVGGNGSCPTPGARTSLCAPSTAVSRPDCSNKKKKAIAPMSARSRGQRRRRAPGAGDECQLPVTTVC